MPRHFGIRKRKEIRGAGSNIEKLAKDFAEQVHFGKAEDTKMGAEDIKKKFSI
jgi:hypothetical protein